MTRVAKEPPKSASQIELEALKDYYKDLAIPHYTPQQVAAWIEAAWIKAGVYDCVVRDVRRINVPHAIIWQVHYYSVSSIGAHTDQSCALVVYELAGGVLQIGISEREEDKYDAPIGEVIRLREAKREEVRRRYAASKQKQEA